MSNFQVHKLSLHQPGPHGTEEYFFASHDAAAAAGKELGEGNDLVMDAFVSVHPVMGSWPSLPVVAECEGCGENGIRQVYDSWG